MADIVNITPIDPNTFELQDYSTNDTSLITNVEVQTSFNPSIDKIEYFIYTLNGNILYSNVTGYRGYKLIDNNLVLDPETDVREQGYDQGQFNTIYNFVSPKLASSPLSPYFISQISPDRTEIRLDTTSIPNNLLISSSLELISNIQNSTGSYYDFYLDFGDNQLVIANNALLDTSSIDNPTVLIKLYESLPPQFDINTQLWVVTQVANSIAYSINITPVFDIVDETIQLKGPNLNLSLQDQINNSTDYTNISQLKTTTQPQGSGSLSYQLNSMLAQTGVEINVDYSDYSNFIHFSSAQTRLENFYYKLALIEQYNYSASYSSNASSGSYYISSSNIIWQNKINEIITGFDDYEYYLYYTSGSTSWPKTNSTPPYVNDTTTSVAGQAWFLDQSSVAEEYDNNNNNALKYAIPSYLRDDSQNAQFELFVEMIGQYFDTVFLYTQDVTNKYNADNRVNYGVSKDLVADILRDMGVKIYQNNFSTNDLYSALLGFTPSGSLYNLPFTTGSLPTPTGYEYINTYITASATGSLVPTEDLNAEIYKRIYSNLPYLLKKKGTTEGLKALVTLYGIPDTILQVNEFGGQNEIDENDYDLWFDQYNYAFNTLGTNYLTSSFYLNTLWSSPGDVPASVEFRFKTTGLPTDAGYYSQSLWSSDQGAELRINYTGSGYSSGSFSGSIVDPYNKFAWLEFFPDSTDTNTSASVYLPLFDGGWWSVLVNKAGSDFELYAGNKNYNGNDFNFVSYFVSSSINGNQSPWEASTIAYLGSGSLGKILSGSLQEYRFYTSNVDSSAFRDYVMYPYSIDTTGINTAPNTLAFRATLGGELYTASLSVHPKITGSWSTIQSFNDNTSTFTFINDFTSFGDNTETVYPNQFPAGIKNRVSNKVRQQNEVLPYSGSNEVNLPPNTILSPFISVQQDIPESGSYTPNIDYVEVAFSPQNEINNDIASQLGYFNIGDYIGDPRLVSSSSETYPQLDALRDYYFEKYTGNYNIWDYIRLIKYFDNSLFKMIQDWVPARTNLASGIVLKQTTLERNKYPVPQLTNSSSVAFYGSNTGTVWNTPFVVEDLLITGSSIQISTITGSTGGTMPDLFGLTSSQYTGYNVVNITQSWAGTTPSLSGSVPFIQSSQTEFYDGELSGSILEVENGELNEANPLKTPSTQIITYQVTGSNNVINGVGFPGTGVIYWAFDMGLIGGSPTLNDYVNEIWINEISNENIDILNALQNLNPGDDINFTVTYALWDGINPYIPQTKNITTSITSITPVSSDAWRIGLPFNDGTTINYDNLTFGVIYLSGSSNVIFNPFINSIPNYSISEYNPVINNELVARPNYEFFDVDFSSNAIIAVNAENIISASRGLGTATPSTVPQSNYTTARSANPRYFGSETISPVGNRWQSFVNQPMTTGSTIGAVTNIENYSTWFAYFDNITPVDVTYDLYIGNIGPVSDVSTQFSASAVHITSLININGEKIELSPTNNTPLSGSTVPNPLTSNIPLVNTLFPSNIWAGRNAGTVGGKQTPCSLRLYELSGSNINVVSGSFSNFQVFTSGVQPLPYLGIGTTFLNVYGDPNETIVLLATGSFITPTGNISGLLIPGNFDPKYSNSLLQIAQSAGFFRNI